VGVSGNVMGPELTYEFRPPWAEMPSGRAPRATPDDVVPVAAAQLLLSRVGRRRRRTMTTMATMANPP